MNNFIKYFFGLTLFLALYSCKEVTQVNLNNYTEKLVIEAYIEKDSWRTNTKLIVSRTTNFYDSVSSIPKAINWAIISDNLGNIDTFNPIFSNGGLYRAGSIQAEIGRTYYLTVSIDDKIYQAQSTLNPCPPIDSFYSWDFLTAKNKVPSIIINEPFDETNYYRYNISLNGNQTNLREYVFEDRLINGSRWRFSPNGQFYKVDDRVAFSLLGIDKANFDYWKILVQNQATDQNSNNNSAAPTNPPTNITGGEVLGYFSAHQKRTVEFVIQ